jgi:hypothetical protein
MSTISKMVVSGIFAILVAAFSLAISSLIQVNAQESGDPCLQPPSAKQEEACQKAMQTADCMQLKTKMASDNTAADLYQKKDCAGLLAGK